jgi:hypothetical protein
VGALTDTKIRHLKPDTKAYQVADGEGLILEVRPSGQKSWLYRYRLYGRAEKLSLGTYPDVTLAKAREDHGDARKLVTAKKSPAQLKQDEKRRLSDDLRTCRVTAVYLKSTWIRSSHKRARHYVEEDPPVIGRNSSTSDAERPSRSSKVKQGRLDRARCSNNCADSSALPLIATSSP